MILYMCFLVSDTASISVNLSLQHRVKHAEIEVQQLDVPARWAQDNLSEEALVMIYVGGVAIAESWAARSNL